LRPLHHLLSSFNFCSILVLIGSLTTILDQLPAQSGAARLPGASPAQTAGQVLQPLEALGEKQPQNRLVHRQVSAMWMNTVGDQKSHEKPTEHDQKWSNTMIYRRARIFIFKKARKQNWCNLSPFLPF